MSAGRFGTFSWSDLAPSYKRAFEFFSNLTSLPAGSRLDRYDQILKHFSGVKNDAQAFEYLVADPDHIAAFYEARDFIDTAEGLSLLGKRLLIPPDRLRKVARGVESYAKAKPNDVARNTFYELSVGAKLVKRGISVKFPESENAADIVASFRGRKIFIECKRNVSEKTLEENVRKGFEQLESRYTRPGGTDTGVVFLSVDALVNPDMELIHQRSADDIVAYSVYHAERLSRIIEVGLGNKKPDQRNTLGYLLTTRFPAFDRSTGRVHHRSYRHSSACFSAVNHAYYIAFCEKTGAGGSQSLI